MNRTWTAERVARLTELWNQGVAARLIAVDIGLTKSAIVGKAHRLELPGRGSPIDYSGRSPEKKALRQAACEPPKRLEHHSGGHMPTGRTVTHMAKMAAGFRPKTCQWPIGDPDEVDFHFCGAQSVERKPYCPEHCTRAYLRAQAGAAA
jgi:GcrA cell cycle regulator